MEKYNTATLEQLEEIKKRMASDKAYYMKETLIAVRNKDSVQAKLCSDLVKSINVDLERVIKAISAKTGDHDYDYDEYLKQLEEEL